MNSNAKQISTLFNGDGRHSFVVPKYQRNYSWRRDNWEKLFDDIAASENGHFLGSFICIRVKSSDSMTPGSYELVDGQQRFTTISLLLCAIYERLSEFKVKDDEALTADRVNLRGYLFVNGEAGQLRYIPTEQSTNKADFEHVLCSSFGETWMPGHSTHPKNFGNRLIAKCKKIYG